MSGEIEMSSAELHAFIDGALDVDHSRAFAARVESDPVLAARVAAFRADKKMLQQIYKPLADRPIPESWIALARNTPPPRPRWNWRLASSIAAIMVLVLAGALIYANRPAPPAAEIVEAALDARIAKTGAERVIAVGGNVDVSQYDAVLTSTVSSTVKVPDLKRLNYRLAEIRLYPRPAGGGSAELLYRDDKDRLFTLYLRRSSGAPRFDQFERAGLRVCVWEDEELSTVMAGNISTAAMQRLASLAYTGLTLG